MSRRLIDPEADITRRVPAPATKTPIVTLVTSVTLSLLGFDFHLDDIEADDESGALEGWCIRWMVDGVEQDIVDAGIEYLQDALMVAVETATAWRAEADAEKARLEAEMFGGKGPGDAA